MTTAAASASDIDRRVGARIKAARALARVSLKQLGLAVDITYQQIQKYEAGRNRITVGTLQRIAAHLQVPAASFLDPDDTDAHPPLAYVTAENLRLLKAFTRIANPKLRAGLVSLVEAAAGPPAKGQGG
jgi:transcriptional regulator with XRE-family HTH domain